jgi:peptide/nickel transport system permease protein/peptide/nickel transport system substrate-binding protein
MQYSMSKETAMRVRRISRAAALGFAAIALALGGCTSPDAGTAGNGEGTAAEGGVLVVAHNGEPTNYDPQKGNGGHDHVMLWPVYETLINYSPEDLTPQPGLAESWDWASPTELVLHLREGVTFQDGTPFDAEAVKVNLDRAREEGASSFADLSTISEVTVVDPATVSIGLSTPYSALVLTLADRAGMMVSPTALEREGGVERDPVGAGPYQFVEWRGGDRVILERYDDYWDGENVHLDGLEFRFLSDATARTRALRAGDVDFSIQVEPSDAASLEGSGVTVVSSGSLEYYKMYLNTAQEPFDKVEVRQALNYAIDREALLQTLQLGEGEVFGVTYPSGHWAYDEEAANYYSYDPDKARELLAEAGYADGVSFEMVGLAGPQYQRMGEALQQYFADVGITMSLTQVEPPQYVSQFFDAQDYQAGLATWTGRVDPTLAYSLLYSNASFFNPGKTTSPEIEELIVESAASDEIEQRAEVFKELNALVVEEALEVGLFFRPGMDAHSASVQNYTPSILGKPRFDGVRLTS